MLFIFLLSLMQTHLFIDKRKRARWKERREEDRRSWGNGEGEKVEEGIVRRIQDQESRWSERETWIKRNINESGGKETLKFKQQRETFKNYNLITH